MNVRLLDTLLKRMDAGTEAIMVQEPFASGTERCILIFDRSGSMAIGDYPPSRLLAAFDAGLEFVAARQATGLSDLISIILFDDAAEYVCEDVSLMKAVRVLNRLKAENPIGGGTDINSGLLAAEDKFRRTIGNYKNRIILLTDGHGGNPERTGRRLREADVRLDVIGVAGCPEDVQEHVLRNVASVVNNTSCYRFIQSRDDLLRHFTALANSIMQVK